MPSEFVPVAEETGLIVPIGQWVIETACHQLREWQLSLPSAAGLFVAVNVSARQLRHPGLVADFARALRETGVDPTGVTLEVTESVLVDDAESTTAVLHRLKALGVQIAIDDFGTGYSSLGYLSRLPVDRLKIDRSFVKGLGEYGQDHAIVRGIIELAGSLELSTVAEGIETDVQLATLQELGSANGQGFLFARPLSPEDVGPLLSENDRLAA
jgi:EAL domain-containing protein (putative c-di-GMP-specific phosphodiesterase class I)